MMTSDTETAIAVRPIDERVSVIDIHGDLTAASEAELMEAYRAASGPHTKSVVLNFSGLDYMNSTGIGLLVTLLVRAQRQHQQIRAYGLSEHYRQIFELTRLDEAIQICPSEREALSQRHVA